MNDFVVIGGGIVGLSTAMALARAFPGCTLTVLEKEAEISRHQSGRNSGVIHSGIYYTPGSLKAKFCVLGSRSLVDFCRDHDVAHEVCGKLIVATEPRELPQLAALSDRGRRNGLNVVEVPRDELGRYEPHVGGLAGLWVPSTGIADFVGVCHVYRQQVELAGGRIQVGVEVVGVSVGKRSTVLETSKTPVESAFVINCAGLHSDRVASLWGTPLPAKIVPFRGEYYELIPEKRGLVNNLVYPVPNPAFPFLGVHLTRGVDGSVHVGPNAVLGLKREGYRKTDFNWRDAKEVLGYRGFWKLALRHAGQGVKEWGRSLSKGAFVRNVQRMLPEVTSDDLLPSPSGVRAMALQPDGRLIDDFLIVAGPRSLHVLNAPSPAATSSLEIGKAIAAKVHLILN